jgi:hypothetical protein
MRVRLIGGDDALDALDEALGDAIEDSVGRASEVIAHAARADHPYTDRSGDLTGSIEALPVVRTEDGARGGVLAGMTYASHVEAKGYAFLDPAAQRSEGRIDQALDDALEAAVRRGTP